MMKITRIFNNFKIKTKLLVLTLIIFFFLAVLTAASLYSNVLQNRNMLSLIESSVLNAYDLQIKSQVQSAISQLNGIYDRYLSGEITLEQAKKLGADSIRSMRYGNGYYFWVDTTEGVNVVLYGSDAEGKNRYHYRDANGTPIIQEFIYNALSGKETCLDYWFPKEGQTEPVRKRGYTSLFKPFGWVVGTGCYMDDIDKEIAGIRQDQNTNLRTEVALCISVFSIFSVLALVTILLISKSISEPLQKSVGFAVKISNGEMDMEIQDQLKNRKDEIGKLAVALEKMKDALAILVNRLTEKADALSSEKELLRTTLISVGDGVISADKTGRVILINPVAELLTGWPRKEAEGRQLEEIFQLIPETAEEPAVPIQNFFQDGKITIPENNTILLSRTGARLSVESNASPIFEKNGVAAGTVLVFRDVTENRNKIEQIRYLGFHDQLTGLFNRTYFEQQMAQIDNPENRPVSLIMADVNGLKMTNDAYGHLAGDQLIENTAYILKKVCRSDDFIFRIGGDEFVVLLKRTTLEQAQALAQRIRDAAEAFQKESTAFLSISLGCAEKAPANPSMEDVLRQAEDEMYREKLVESNSTRMMILENIKNQLFSTMEEDNENYVAISQVCCEVGKAMNLDSRDLHDLKTAALLHDIGKVTVNRSVLNKPSALAEEEWLEIKHHSEAGYHILKSLNEMSQVAEYVLAHHERWNGIGYPKGLKEKEIPLISRIIAVVDSYYAMISERPYRKAFSQAEALAEISNNAGILYDSKVVKTFLSLLRPEETPHTDI